MKKLLFGLGALLTLLLIGGLLAPYGVGYVIQKKYPDLTSLFCPAHECQVRVVNYQRGWFSSDATLAIEYTSIWQQVPRLLTLQQKILHGPLLVHQLPTSEWVVTPAWVDIVSTINEQLINLSMQTIVHWDRSTTVRMNAPFIISINSNQQAKIIAKNVAATVEIAANQQQINGVIIFPSVIWQTPTVEQTLRDVQLQFNMHQSTTGLWLGQHTLHIANANYHSGDPLNQKNQGLSNIVLNAISTELQGRVNWHIQINADKLALKDRILGPYHLDLMVTNLDAKILLQFKQLLPQLLANAAQPLLGNSNLLWLQLLKQGIAIKLNRLELSTFWGKVLANGDLLTEQPLNNAAAIPSTPLLAGVNGNLNVEFPVAMLKEYLVSNYQRDLESQNALANPSIDLSVQAEKQIAAWQQQGLLINVGNYYRINIRYVQQQMWINGKSLTQALSLPQ